jgi:hypothetical protein
VAETILGENVKNLFGNKKKTEDEARIHDDEAVTDLERRAAEAERRAKMTPSEKLREFAEKQDARIKVAREKLDEAYAVRYRAVTLTGEVPTQLSDDKLEARSVALDRLVDAVENLKYAEGRVRRNERLAEMAGEDEDVKRLFLQDARQGHVQAVKAYGEVFERKSWAVWHS